MRGLTYGEVTDGMMSMMMMKSVRERTYTMMSKSYRWKRRMGGWEFM